MKLKLDELKQTDPAAWLQFDPILATSVSSDT